MITTNNIKKILTIYKNSYIKNNISYDNINSVIGINKNELEKDLQDISINDLNETLEWMKEKYMLEQKTIYSFRLTAAGLEYAENMDTFDSFNDELSPFIKLMLFNYSTSPITLHSGQSSNFKIDCDALTDQDLQSLADLVATKIKFKQAIGVPSGGLRFAAYLNSYADTTQNTILIVDDVLTTGKSMQEYADKYKDQSIKGVVIFARNTCPEWITPIFTMNKEII